MITIQEADAIIANATKPFPIITVKGGEALGCILREDIYADRDQPAFNRSTMDGIAIKFSSWKQGVREFQVQGVQPAGVRGTSLRSQKHCVEIMTGAVIPSGADTVIPVERLKTDRGIAKIVEDMALEPEQFVHKQASDYRKGDLLVKSGCILGPAHIGVLAAVGKSSVKVSRRPRIAIVSTGNELVDINKIFIKPFEVRKSNAYALQALFDKYRFQAAKIFHVRDDLKQMRWQMRKILQSFDILILSGGVSMGKFDLVPQVLMELGVHVLLHKIAQKPGKPMWFGSSREGKVVFALPGNPVSTLLCAYRYVLPYLYKASNYDLPIEWGVLDKEFYVPTDLAFFAPVKVFIDDLGRTRVSVVDFSGSGDFAAMAHSDGFVEFPMGVRDFPQGSKVRLFRW